MTTITALAAVKSRLDITDASWDTLLAEFIQTATARLYPLAQYEVPAQTKAVTVDGYGETIVDLSTLTTPVLAARSIEARAAAEWFKHTDTSHHGTSLTVRDLPSNVTELRIYGLKAFMITSAAGTTTLPDYLANAVYWYAISEFFDYLVGNKRKYNIYAQQTGARGVENMNEQAEYYENKANVFLNDRATIYGA